MGNRALAAALEKLSKEGPLPRFQQIVFTAPDINATIFKRLAAMICPIVERITVYASPKDRALLASKRFHAHPRAGETLVILPGIDTIDASAVDTSLLGHSFFADNRSVLSDIYYLVKDGKPPTERFGLVARQAVDGTYYSFRV
jgi:esterase/lipase superfamily enzyme